MLRSVIVTEVHCFSHRLGFNQETLRDGLTHDVCSWKSPCLRVQLLFDFGDGFWGKIDREEHDLGVNAVFSLGEEIGSDECWVGSFIGDNLEECVNLGPENDGEQD